MQFTKNANANGTSLKGCITENYDTLVEVFGEPCRRGGDKTTVEWLLRFQDGTIATIYDWKTSATPLASYDWHVGGRSTRAVQLVKDAIDKWVDSQDTLDDFNYVGNKSHY
jgi:hypothetical protein